MIQTIFSLHVYTLRGNNKQRRAAAMKQVEKAMREDKCKMCKKSFKNKVINKEIHVGDVVTLHRVMGEYWIYHKECFEEMAGPENVPPVLPVPTWSQPVHSNEISAWSTELMEKWKKKGLIGTNRKYHEGFVKISKEYHKDLRDLYPQIKNKIFDDKIDAISFSIVTTNTKEEENK